MRTWQIWAEGYRVTGNEAGAHHFGCEDAETFEEACKKFAARDQEFAKDFNADRMTYWGCRLFDNEFQARESFG